MSSTAGGRKSPAGTLDCIRGGRARNVCPIRPNWTPRNCAGPALRWRRPSCTKGADVWAGKARVRWPAIQNGHSLLAKNAITFRLLVMIQMFCATGRRWRSSFVLATLSQNRASPALRTSPSTLARPVKSRLFEDDGFQAVPSAQASASSYCSPTRSIGNIGWPAALDAEARRDIPRCPGRRRHRHFGCTFGTHYCARRPRVRLVLPRPAQRRTA